MYYTCVLYIWIIHMDYTYVLYICIVHMYYTYVLCMCVCVFVSTFPCYDQIIVKYAYRYLDVYFAPSNFWVWAVRCPKEGYSPEWVVSQFFPLSSAPPVHCQCTSPSGALPMHLSKWARSLCWCSESDCQLCQVFSVSWVYYRSW
jgi:hypothetical protein